MILLVTGGRHFTSFEAAFKVMDRVHAKVGISLVVHGDAVGADTLAKRWALVRKVPHLPFEPDWVGKGLGAGKIRNSRMLEYLLTCKERVGVLAFPGGTGTAHMVGLAHANNITVMEALRDNFRTIDQYSKDRPNQKELGF